MSFPQIGVRRQARSSSELVEEALAAIEAHNGRTNAFTCVYADRARAEARIADRERASGLDRGPFHGVPISIKDLIDVAGEVTSAGSRVLADQVAAADATVITRLRDAGAIIIGRTNLHEFALGTTCEDSAFGPVRHPADPTRSAGGSSGGSAVAVALGMGVASVGTDTGGSIRIPASACGVVGLKPTIGEVPTGGVIPLSLSLDHVGPLATCVQDGADLWAILAGHRPAPVDTVEPKSIRLGQLDGYFSAPLEPDVRHAFAGALDRLTSFGITIARRELPDTGTIVEAYVSIVLREAATWHQQFLESRRSLYTPTVGARLESGREITREQYLKARATSDRLRRHVNGALESVDVLVLPTLPIVAPPLGTADLEIEPGQSLTTRAAMLKHTQPFNMSGHPAISIPIPAPGLPVGLQLVGRLGETSHLLAIAAACERIVNRA